MIRNVTDGAKVHRAALDVDFEAVFTACGRGPLHSDEWTFTDDKVTCEECKQ